MADDGIDEIVQEAANRLIDNIMGSDDQLIFQEMSYSTKERVLKDHLTIKIRNFFNSLNDEFKDVYFQYAWIHLDPYQSSYHEVSNEEYTDDEHNIDDLYNYSPDNMKFYEVPLSQIGMKIEYIWKRHCSLGHQHRTKRFQIVNMPKVLDALGYIRLGMPVRTWVKEFIPDFFYDPMKQPAKRGRPKKASHS